MRVGLAGCGAIGRKHAGNLRGRAGLLFFSRTRARAEEFAREFGGEVCASYEELLERADGVVIATPPERHETETVAALASGAAAVLVEKPLCHEPDQLLRIEAAAARHPGTVLMVAENYYYKPSLLKLKQHIRSGDLGEIERIEVKKLKQQKASGWRAAHGSLLEGGIHFVALAADLLDAATGSECGRPRLLGAEFPGRQSGEAERHAVVALEAPGGPKAEIRYAWNVPSPTGGVFQHSRIAGSEGGVLFESNGIYHWVRSQRRRALEFPGFRDMMGYRGMMEDFLACLEDRGRSPYSNLARARRDLQIVFDAYRSLEE